MPATSAGSRGAASWNPAPLSDEETWQDAFTRYITQVEASGVEALDGYNINLMAFKEKLPLCVKAGLITAEQADFTLHGLEFGFDLGVDHAKMAGRRVHKNYASAYANEA